MESNNEYDDILRAYKCENKYIVCVYRMYEDDLAFLHGYDQFQALLNAQKFNKLHPGQYGGLSG